MTYDVVTFGESMLQLLPAGDLRFEQSTSFDVHVAGSESNTAVGLSRLGARVNWFSRLPDSVLGRLARNRLREHGVEVSNIVWADDDRMGWYFVEKGTVPRPTEVIYDRANSAMSRIQPDDIPKYLFQRGIAKLLHASGISMAISDSASQTVKQAINYAKKASWLVSFDVNYRSKLWSADAARSECELVMEQADIIFIPKRDAQLLYGVDVDRSIGEILLQLHKRFPRSIIVMSDSEQGSWSCSTEGDLFKAPAYPTNGIYRIGAGDAFSAGFLYCYLCVSTDLTTALSWGNATASLKFTIPGDLPLIDKQHVVALTSNIDNKLFR